MNILDSKSFSSQNRNMIQELINLRQNNWVPSHESEARKIAGKIIQGDDIQSQNENGGPLVSEGMSVLYPLSS